MLIPGRRKILAQMLQPIPHNYAAEYFDVNLPTELATSAMWSLRVSVENQSDWIWKRQDPEGKNVDLTVWIDDRIAATQALPIPEVHPGQRVHFRLPLQGPASAAAHEIVIVIIEQNIARFQDKRSARCNQL